MHKFHKSIFREYDIRGVVNETLYPTDAYHIGRRYGTLVDSRLGGKKICVGYDGRLSSPALAAELIRGLKDSGMDVVELGLGPTPMVYYSVFELDADGGIMITGSHNPPSHNGFKIMLGKDSLFGAEIAGLEKITEYKEGFGSVTKLNIKTRYIMRLLQDCIIEDGYKIGWDPGNGASGEIVQKLCKALPGKHFLINEKIDGKFPAHHPDPTIPENLEQLAELVSKNKLDVGFAFDGDGDRLGIIDEKGDIIWGDQLLAILAQEVLAENPGATIIADVKSSRLFEEEVSRLGGKPLIWKTGHSLIKTKMKEMQAPLAGEMSAHIFFADKYYGFDDGIYAALRFLNIMQNSGKTASELLRALPRYYSSLEYRIPCKESDKLKIISDLKNALKVKKASFSDIDGVRVNYEDSWWLLRASNTGNYLVARFEAKTEKKLAELEATLSGFLAEYGYFLEV